MLFEKGLVALQSVPEKSCFGNKGNLFRFLSTKKIGEIYKFIHPEFLLSYPSLSLYFTL